MFKKIVVFFFFLVVVPIFGDTRISPIGQLVTKVYGSVGIKSSENELKKIESLMHELHKATPKQLHDIAELLIIELKMDRKEIKKKIASHETATHQAAARNFYTLFILQHQIQYLQDFLKKQFKELSFIEQLQISFSDSFKKFHQWIYGDDSQNTQWEESVADRIFDYLTFERNEILFNFNKLIVFFSAIKKYPLPPLINFWSNSEVQQKLLARTKTLTDEVEIQQFEEIFMIALQSYLMAGNSMYLQWLDQADADAYAKSVALQNKIQGDFEIFVKKIDAAQKNITTQIVNAFKTSEQKLSDDYSKVNEQNKQELIYLFKSINLDYPIQHALTLPPIPYDQVFEASVMKTPGSQRWYNVYQFGDWEFDTQTNSFWQNLLVPFNDPVPYWSASSGQSSVDPSQNSIFTEYSSNDKSYQVTVECTLVQCTYPFFMGVCFNRGRWISADPERLWQYRLFGLYGTQSNPADNNTRSIGVSFAQQIIEFNQGKETIIAPLAQIATNPKTQLATLSKQNITMLDSDPLTFIFSITTSSDSVTLSISKKDTGQQLFAPITLQNLSSYLALYGGIGFMAPGCIAQFKVIKPEALVASANDLKNFTEKK